MLILFQPQQSNIDPALALRGPPSHGSLPPAPVTRQEWKSIVAAVPKGGLQGDFLVKAPVEFCSRTNSKHLIGYTFVGANALELATTKGSVTISILCLVYVLISVQQQFPSTPSDRLGTRLDACFFKVRDHCIQQF